MWTSSTKCIYIVILASRFLCQAYTHPIQGTEQTPNELQFICIEGENFMVNLQKHKGGLIDGR